MDRIYEPAPSDLIEKIEYILGKPLQEWQKKEIYEYWDYLCKKGAR